MQNTVNGLLQVLAGRLAVLGPFAKAIVPAALSLVTAGVNCAFTGTVNTNSLIIAGCGLALAVVTYFVPNIPLAPKPAAVPAAPAAPVASATPEVTK